MHAFQPFFYKTNLEQHYCIDIQFTFVFVFHGKEKLELCCDLPKLIFFSKASSFDFLQSNQEIDV